MKYVNATHFCRLTLYLENLLVLFIRSDNFGSVVCIFCVKIMPILYSFILFIYFFSFIFISWRLITLQYCSGLCHTLTWISHGFTCIPHPDPCSHLPLYLISLGLPSAPALLFFNESNLYFSLVEVYFSGALGKFHQCYGSWHFVKQKLIWSNGINTRYIYFYRPSFSTF